MENKIENKDATFIIKAVDAESREVVRGAILELYDNQNNLIKTIDMKKDGTYDGSKDNLADGTYYIKVISAPYEHNLPLEEQIVKYKYVATEVNIWEVEFPLLGFELPSYNKPFMNSEESGEAIDYDTPTTLKVEAEALEYWDSSTYNLYEIATFDPGTGKYTYCEPFQNLGLSEISEGSMADYNTANLLMKVINEKQINPIILHAPGSDVVTYLRKDRCYLIAPEDFETLKYRIIYRPLILPFAETPGYNMYVNLYSWYDIIEKSINMEIINSLYNPELTGTENFVYKITGYNQGEEVFSKIVNIKWDLQTQNKRQQKAKTIEIPITEEIQVEQVYSGTCFYCVSDSVVRIPEEELASLTSVTFSNDLQYTMVKGNSIAGLGRYSENEGWSWKYTDIGEAGFTSMNAEGPAAWKFYATVNVEDIETQSEFYVRFKVFSDSDNIIISDDDGKWSPAADGYYYYSDIINPNSRTTPIQVQLEVADDVAEGAEIHLVMISELTKVQYREDGTPYSDWSLDFNLNE